MDIVKWARRGASFVEHPSAMMLRRKGVISDFYIKLDRPWIRDLNIKTVLDIGGNVGRFSKTVQYLLPKANIVAFEPLPQCFEQMINIMRDHERFTAHNVGLGAEESMMEMNLSSHAPSSSLLPMSDVHKDAFPFAERNEKIQVEIKRLDDIDIDFDSSGSTMIKVDVQGYERSVIEGGTETFAKADLLLLELSFKELYEGQPLFEEVYDLLRPLSFKFLGNLGLMLHPETGEPLDADCLFVKEPIK